MADPETAKSTQDGPGAGRDQSDPAGPQAGTSPSTVKQEPEVGATAATASNGKVGDSSGPAEICVVIGGSRNAQAQGSYVCGICGKKYKYYNCFQTHVRAHRESEGGSGEGGSQAVNCRWADRQHGLSACVPADSFRNTCDICGKNYKYYSCFQEHRDLHAVDDPYDQVVIPVDDQKDEEQMEPFQKIGPVKTGSYVCEYCGKQYKYFNPYQEHVALHTPIGRPMQSAPPRSQQRSVDSAKCSTSKSEPVQIEGATCRKREGKMQASQGDTNSSQNSSGTASPQVSGSFPTVQKPYTCGACGIQFQFYNNLLEHMQSHAADNENHTKVESPKTSPAPTPQEQVWKPPAQAQRNHNTSMNSVLPEKERQQVAERLLRVMCADPGLLGVLGGKDFLKLAQTLVDSGARHGAYSVRDGLGDMGSLALRQLPRTYNQVKVKVTCALGSSASLGIAVTCHSQTVGAAGSCYVLTAYQVEGVRLRRYVLGVKEVDLREPGEQVHHWVQNVLSEFVMSDVRAVYVTEPRAAAAAAFCGRVGACLRCAGCSLGAVAQAVLGKRSLQTRGLHELAELLAACRDIAGAAGLPWDAGVGGPEEPSPQAPPPPCWDRTTEALLKVHQRFDQICEVYGRSKSTAPLLQSLNKHLLGTLASLLAPLRQAAVELSSERRPTLQMVLPAYLRLEKLFTSKAGEAGAGSKLCHYFLEALKENFKVERAHQVAMVLDPQLKLRPVPAYQHEEIIGKVCEAAAEMKEGPGGGGGVQGEDCDSGGPEGPPGAKRCRTEGGDSRGSCTSDQQQVRKEVFQYLAEPLFHATPDLFQYWSSVMEKYPRLARLALWLLAVPAVGVRGECAGVCEQTLALKRRQQVTAEEMNKLIFLRSNMS
ncbi:LOW QUALITY PROTEIN: zinc finger protein 618 [Brienomyrus brachyistius]|uniref:LOW QUALITY PROTEIN: zinc finger protein 618 n=1 Tax=Brienomyrus brachyistius TaxID=42636 RepID=UPI0020B1D84F|nr:LOW QUALITY PROTEIN: zinc finger protein 618 [Brienomyrus brachyistius]